MSDSLRPYESQHTRPPCPSPTPRVYSNSCPSSCLIHDSPKREITQMSINRCMAKYMVYSYSAIKRRELLIQTIAWMNLKNMLSERSQTQKNTYRLMLKLKLQYFDHLMRTADSLGKNLMLAKIEGRRRRGYTLLLLLLSHFSRVRLCATPQTAAHQAPPSLGFSRQEHWSGLPFPSPMHESEK
ncbi:hypothetical protein FD755_021191 [Muntiacus reevesi]|uniref:Uncharacterized protein n=1 Tax=Muntiacus reevesi TaxID=9886 RepID=A0A5N3X413_MUNRE|nr:hypothetical protein FD755_021191 [Muntiacus reevesi]